MKRLKRLWPFGVVVRVRDAHGFIVRRRIAVSDLPVLTDGLTPASETITETQELREQLAMARAALGRARCELGALRDSGIVGVSWEKSDE